MSILVITTGGTIGAMAHDDPQKPPKYSTMPTNDLVCTALDQKFSSYNSRCVTLEPRDSKNIDEPYRLNILKLIEQSPENGILLTHGTDTLLQTAEFLYQQFGARASLNEKVVVITGSMVPLMNGAQSDGYLNLQYSLEQLKSRANLKSGNIYIVLCDHGPAGNENDPWQPHIYQYEPGQFEKFHAEDARYSRLVRVQ